MSATSPASTSFIEFYLKSLDLTIINSNIPCSLEESNGPITAENYMAANKEMARLVFCSEDDEAIYRKLGEKQGLKVQKNCTSAESYRNLSPSDMLLVTNENYMRGVDYQTTSDYGISLLIARTLSNPRMAKQAFGRVGRFLNKSKRYFLKDLKLNEAETYLLDAAFKSNLKETQKQA